MYNESIKQRYLNIRKESDLPTQIVERSFTKSEKFETELEKDAYNFTIFEIKNMYQTLSIRSLNSLRNINSALRKYTDWALKENLVKDAQNHYAEMRTSDYESCINIRAVRKRLLTRKQVLSYCNQLSEPSDKFLLLATFEGIGGEEYCELNNLTIGDFDKKNLTVKLCTGRTMQISQELYNFAVNSAAEYSYRGKNGMALRAYPLIGDDLIIKIFPQSTEKQTSFVQSRRIYNRMSHIFDWLGIAEWMTINALRDSGIVEFLLEKKKSGVDPISFVSGTRNSEWLIKVFKEQFGFELRRNWYDQCKGYLE